MLRNSSQLMLNSTQLMLDPRRRTCPPAYVQRCSTSLDAYLAAPPLSKSAHYTEMHQLCGEASGAMQQIINNIGPGPLAAINAAASTAAHMSTVLANSPDLSVSD